MGAALLYISGGLFQRVGKGAKRIISGAAQTFQHGGQVSGAQTVADLTPQRDGTGCAGVGDKTVGDALFFQRFAHRAGDGETGLQPTVKPLGAFTFHIEQNGGGQLQRVVVFFHHQLSRTGTLGPGNGFHTLNARLAVESAVQLGCDRQKAIEAVSSYKGISRRMTLRRNDEKLIVIEDYAHHPKEVERAIDFLRIKYPDCHLRIVFQPHRYARLEKFFDDFVRVLRGADSLFTVPVFAAWTESGKVDSAMLAGECGGIFISGVWQENAEKVLVPPEDGRKLLIAVLGAGDIEEIIPYL